MLVLAVTGGMGAGKSEAAAWFAARGAAVLDLDVLAKDLLLAPGSPLAERVVEAFGAGVLGPDGAVDARTLAAAAFAGPRAARRLDAITHPAVVTEVRERLASLRDAAEPPTLAVVDVPLLVEAPDLREQADLVLAVEAPLEERLSRLAARGIPRDEALRRMACQSSEEDRRAMADAVVVNDGSREDLARALECFWDREVAPRVA